MSWSVAFRVSLAGVRRRLGRSLITTAGVVLAIAFMSYMLCTESIARALIGLNDDKVNVGLQAAGVDIYRGGRADPVTYLLLGLTLLACGVGIVNSMLMAVAERVREIGTLKCLGARDEFILKVYFIESFLHGICGAAAGVASGVLVAAGAGWYSYGLSAVHALSLPELARIFAVSLAVGAMISVIASLFPAYAAARKQPVEALRVEE